jgi:hypothetical protein
LKVLRVNESILGRRVRCPGCQSTIMLPTAEELSSFGQQFAPPYDGQEELDADALVEDSPFRGGGLRKLFNGPDGTNVNLGVSAGLALGLTIAFYVLVVFPLYMARTYFGELFWSRGWVQHASTFLAFWAGVILLFKVYLLRRQRRALRLPVLPATPEKITPGNVETFLSHVRDLARDTGTTFLLRRVWRALEHFRVTGSRQDVAAQLDTQAQVDGTTAAGSYTLVKVCLGAIPILGFIGTCIGIAVAVESFSGAMSASDDLKQLKTSLRSVTGGLAVAFDTTLLALGLSLLILFASNGLEKREEAVLNAIDEYCSEKLLRRLQDGSTTTTAADKPAASIESAIQQALIPYQAELRTWIDKFNGVADALSKRVTQGWQAVQQQAQEATAQQVQQLRALQETHTRELANVSRGMSDTAARVHMDLSALQTQQISHAKDVAGTLHNDLRAVEQQGREVQKVLTTEWKQVLDLAVAGIRTLQTETVAAQTEVRQNLRNVCEALRNLVVKLQEAKPCLDEINATVAKAQVLVDASTLPGNGEATGKPARRWWQLGKS